jgi:hypothetical protein
MKRLVPESDSCFRRPVHSPESFSQVAPLEMHRCVECHDLLSKAELMVFDGFYACPQCKPLVIAKIRRGEPVGSAFRDGKRLVARKDAVLPDRCVKCNAPAEGFRVKMKLHPTTLEFGLCPIHQKRRRMWRLAASALSWGGWACMVSSCSPISAAKIGLGNVLSPSHGLLLLLASGVVSSGGHVFKVTRTTKKRVFLTELHPDYLAEFPEWPGD